MTILVCEPQCWGVEHAHFNAALLKTIRLAHPQAAIHFMSEPGHWQWVNSYLTRVYEGHLKGVEWEEMDIPQQDYQHWGLFTIPGYQREQNWLRHVEKRLAEQEAGLLVITSITTPGLLAVKSALYTNRIAIPTLIIPHSILALVLHRSKRFRGRLRNQLIGFTRILKLPHPARLRYILLGDSILNYLRQAEPGIAAHCRAIDLPYFWNTLAVDEPPKGAPSFGYFGNAGSGFDQYIQLADVINQDGRDVQFWLVGHLKYPEKYSSYTGIMNGLASEPLSNEEYARRAEGITYTVGIADSPDRYRLVASASFLDSISFIKPGIYLKNPYIAFYFEKMGDIGYLCDNLDEMRKVILALVREFPAEKYRQQQMNILQGRQIFEPQRVAEQFRNITIEFGL